MRFESAGEISASHEKNLEVSPIEISGTEIAGKTNHLAGKSVGKRWKEFIFVLL